MKEITLQVTEEEEVEIQKLLKDKKTQKMMEDNQEIKMFSMKDLTTCLISGFPVGGGISTDYLHINLELLNRLYKEKLKNL